MKMDLRLFASRHPIARTPRDQSRQYDGVFEQRDVGQLVSVDFFVVPTVWFRIVAAMNIEEVLSAPGSPWQNAYAERSIGSIRRDCLDHMIVFDTRSLKRLLQSYFDDYHRSRTDLSLEKHFVLRF